MQNRHFRAPESRQTVTVALLGLPDSTAATLYGFYDALASTRRDWTMLHGIEVADSPFRPLVVSRDGLPFQAGNGVWITPGASFDQCPRPNVVCVTDVLVPPGAEVGHRYDEAIAWIRRCYDNGAVLASACSGAVVLAARAARRHGCHVPLGLLRCAQREFPHAMASGSRSGRDRPGSPILMAGSGVSWHLLVLAIISFASAGMRCTSRMNLMDVNTASPMAYASLAWQPCIGPVIARAASAGLR
jgi:putative intracellular protease/amidase